ncbi:MAG: AraC family transcriptional regulator [Lachnospiraceae bacterium]|nr:AraC family transcriptional regulator [bacterium]MDY5517529.1 AraC family transcriptional regulator [Lachnospiraceae bacterium]
MNIPEYESYHEQKSHFDAAFPYNTYLCSIPLDFMQVPLHWHEEVEFIYIKKGCGAISVDFTTYEVHAEDIALILPGQLHAINGLPDQSMEYENIIFHPKMLESSGADSSYHTFLKPLFSMQFACPVILTKKDSSYATVRSCLDRNDNICKSFPAGYPLAIKGNLFASFFALYTSYSDKKRDLSAGKNIEKLKSVIKYVELNYASPMTIAEMADLAGFSESHFMKYFKNTMGVTFTSYLNSYRLTMAGRLLLQSDDTILSIATEVGFDNLSYFNRAFKKQFGMTPSAYRQAN